MSWRQKILMAAVNFYPPFVGCGVRIRRAANGSFRTSMKLRWWNRNYVGTHFGGSLYLMTDPWLMLILMERLGSEYLVWDQSASIKFVTPGRTEVVANFEISEAEVEQVRREIEQEGVSRPRFIVEVKDRNGAVVAVVEKGLWAARKKKARAP